MNEFIDYLFEDFKCGFDKAKPRDGGTIEAYEFRADCFTYDEIDGNWTRHRPTRNRTFIVETQKPYPDEYHDRYFDQMTLRISGRWVYTVSKLQAAFGAIFQ